MRLHTCLISALQKIRNLIWPPINGFLLMNVDYCYASQNQLLTRILPVQA